MISSLAIGCGIARMILNNNKMLYIIYIYIYIYLYKVLRRLFRVEVAGGRSLSVKYQVDFPIGCVGSFVRVVRSSSVRSGRSGRSVGILFGSSR